MRNTEFKGLRDIIGSRYIFFAISLLVVGSGVAGLVINKGLNLGVDFTGGVLIQYPTTRQVSTSDVEAVMNGINIKHNPPQIMGNGKEFLLRAAGCDKQTDPACKKYVDQMRDVKIRFRLAFTDVKPPVVEMLYMDSPMSKPDIEAALGNDAPGVTVKDAVSTANPHSDNDPETYTVKVTLDGASDKAAYDKAATAIYTKLGGYDVSAEKGETLVSPAFSEELFKRALLALLIATTGILIYVTIRFEFWFAIAAIIALIHDVALTLGMYSLFKLEVNASFVAVILTVFGYSINDTIVIFDRIRENLRKDKTMPWHQLINVSLWETMTRSINTVLTVEIMILAIICIGGASIRDFAIGLFIGITTGCYSSIFIAAPAAFIFKTMGGKKERFDTSSPAGKKKTSPKAAARPASASAAPQAKKKSEIKTAAEVSQKKAAAPAAGATADTNADGEQKSGGQGKKKPSGKQRRR